jgi:acetoin utilization deacetylase AcuC-like enzyme
VGSGDQAATAALERIVAPAARRFRPDILLASAGFDAHWRDPLEKLNFQSATYHALLAGLQGLADELCGAHCSGPSLPACMPRDTALLRLLPVLP